MWLRYLLVPAAFVWATAVAAVADARPIHAVFINPGDDTGFWGDVSSVMMIAARQLDMSVEILHSNRDRLAMLASAKDLADRDTPPDVAIIVNELEQGEAMLRILTDAEIPVYFLLNTLTSEQISAVAKATKTSPDVIGSIVANNWAAGYDMVAALDDARSRHSSDTTKLLAILGDDVTPAALEREAGMRAAIEERSSIDLVRTFSVLWDPNVAFQRVETALELIEIDAIWAANDEIALAARRAVDACGERCNDIVISGLNWSRDGVASVRRGELVSTHGGHFLAGGLAISHINSALEDQVLGAEISLEMASINSENVGALADVLTSRDWDVLDFARLGHEMLLGSADTEIVRYIFKSR